MEEIAATSVRGREVASRAAHANMNAILRRVMEEDGRKGSLGEDDEEKMLETCDNDAEAEVLEALLSKLKLYGGDGDVELTVRRSKCLLAFHLIRRRLCLFLSLCECVCTQSDSTELHCNCVCV